MARERQWSTKGVYILQGLLVIYRPRSTSFSSGVLRSSTIFALLLLLSCLVSCGVLPTHRSRLPLPPGPRELPLVGKLFGRPSHHAWLTYTKWGTTFGEIMSFTVLGHPIVVLNSLKAANDLLDKRSRNYSARPRFHMAAELMGWGWIMALMTTTDGWKRRRRLFHQHFQAKELPSYHPVQLRATVTLLHKILQSPEEFVTHMFYHPSSLILLLTYGYNSKEQNDWYVEFASRSAHLPIAAAAIPGTFIVDFLPFLKYVPSWFPFAGYQGLAKESEEASVAMRNVPFEEALKSINDGTAPPSFVSMNLEKLRNASSPPDFDEAEIRDVAGGAFGAGADTSYVIILTMIMAIVNHPEVQRRAQAELDEVVGRQRLPTFADRPKLPFIQAIILESFRWRPVTPLAMAHYSKADDVYDGYFVPAGMLSRSLRPAIMHDKEVYKDPETFNPDRFMGDNPEPSPTTSGAFGFGRRICPGRFLSLDTAYIVISSMLWAFTLSNAVDENGDTILVDDMAYGGEFVSHRHPFKCKITPRFSSVASVVDSAVAV
ncbi:cytochrome P450 [Hymenopellis radicata]|nr:cytochrome P450 [Hymenopellis radicata]